MSAGINVGKARVYVDVRGCVDCGTEFAEGWFDAGRVAVKIGSRRPLSLVVSRCVACQMEQEKPEVTDVTV